MFNDIVVERDGRVGTIRISRANFSNAFAYTTYGEIKLSIEQLEADDGIGAIVITGAGKHFSAGGDIKRFKEIIDSKEYLSEENMAYTTQMTKAVKYCTKPTIAMVNGVAWRYQQYLFSHKADWCREGEQDDDERRAGHWQAGDGYWACHSLR